MPTLTVWAAAGAALIMGFVQFWYMDASIPPPEVAASESTPADRERILASPAAAPAAPESVPPIAVTQPAAVSRFQLSGVIVSATAGGRGIALIAVDGGAARAVRVGAPVDGDLVLKNVSQAGAALGSANGPATVVLEMNYVANPTSPGQLASAWRPASFGAQALPPVDADPASQPALIATYSHRPLRSPVAMQAMAPTQATP